MKSTATTMKDHQLIINGIAMPYEIVDTLVVDEKIIVRFDSYGHNLNCNIFCFTRNGGFIWEIQESESPDDMDWNSFVCMWLAPTGEFFVQDWCGMRYVVNLSNGFIDYHSYHK